MKIFSGKTWTKLRLPGLGMMELGWLPLGTTTVYLVDPAMGDEMEIARVRSARPWPVRLAMHLAGVVPLGVVAVTMVGAENVGREFLEAFGQYFRGAVSPLHRAQEMLAGISARPLHEFAALLTAKLVAFQLIDPGRILQVLFPSRIPDPLLTLILLWMLLPLTRVFATGYFLWHL